MNNPYVLTFGKEPIEHIERISEMQDILDDFLAEIPAQQVYMITGVRGSGKTVFMTDLSARIAREKEWVVVDLNANAPDLLHEAAAYLCSDNEFANLFRNAKLNFSLFGFGLEVTNSVPIADIQVALEKMIRSLAAKGKKLLFTIDEVTSTAPVKIFTTAFQQFLRKNLPVFLVMTGLYQNIADLQNQDNLTFLYRAPKISLSPLNIGAMAENYARNLNLSQDQAREMARLTKGYSFAFQVLGYLMWRADGNFSSLIPQFRQYLEERSYEKIWSELSNKDKMVAEAVAATESRNNADIKRRLNMTANEFNPYRIRLIRKGILDGSRRGYVDFTLPFFADFVLDHSL